MKTLNIDEPVPPSLEVVNIDFSGSSRVENDTPISAIMKDPSFVFFSVSLNKTAPGSSRRRDMTKTPRCVNER